MLEELKKWIKDGKGVRNVQVTIGQYENEEYLKIWTYDYNNFLKEE